MISELLNSLANLGPALGSVVAIGLICWKLLDLFARMSGALTIISSNMQANTLTVQRMGENVEQNTKATERMVRLLEKK